MFLGTLPEFKSLTIISSIMGTSDLLITNTTFPLY